MSYGTSYTYEGYLNHITKNRLQEAYDELHDDNNRLWRQLLVYVSMTPPVYAESEVGTKYPWAEFIEERVSAIRAQLEDNLSRMCHISDCQETLQFSPEKVEEG